MSNLDLAARMRESLATEPRSIEQITGEILELKKTAGDAILSIGNRLIEAKGILNHGEWLPWLTEQVEFSERTAQNFMRLAKEWSNPQTLADLGSSKALTLLALPADEREKFMAGTHEVRGEEKSVIDMTSRELEIAVRERNEALASAEKAAAERKAAEEARDEMSRQMENVKASLDAANEEAVQAKKELAALQSRPIDVAIQVDENAVKEARQKAIDSMKDKVDKAEKAKDQAEQELARMKAALDAANSKLESAAKAEKRDSIAADEDLTVFRIVFDRVQEDINKLHGMLIKMRGKGREADAEKLSRALMALADQVRGCAE